MSDLMRVLIIFSILFDTYKQQVVRRNQKFYKRINGENFIFIDLPTSNTVHFVAGEIRHDDYKLLNVNFKPGDVVLDIGGNVGMFSIYLARRYPFLKIYSFEPVRESYENFLKNIQINKIPENTITVINKAITKDGRYVTMSINEINSGASIISENAHWWYKRRNYRNIRKSSCAVQSITLEDIFKEYGIKTCKVLKVDCEGCEFEMLHNTKKEIFGKIHHLRGEFHNGINGFKVEELLNELKGKIKDISIVSVKVKQKRKKKEKRGRRKKKGGKKKKI